MADGTIRPKRRYNKHDDPPGLKTCSGCQQQKPVEEFWAHQNYCKACSLADSNAWQRRNYDAEKHRNARKADPERFRDYHRKRHYGMTKGEFALMLADQGDACAICRSTNPGGRGVFHVDHCHETGTIRGLLCHDCNLGIGHFKDDPERLSSAITYLSKKTRV